MRGVIARDGAEDAIALHALVNGGGEVTTGVGGLHEFRQQLDQFQPETAIGNFPGLEAGLRILRNNRVGG